MSKRKNKLDFNRRGRAVVLDSYMMDSPSFIGLSKEPKILIMLMQQHWKTYEYVDYGIREACKKIPCSKKTAIRAFKELQEKGFIELMKESFFSSRTDSKSRSWKLLWMPFEDKPPENNWDTDKPESRIGQIKRHQQSMQQTPQSSYKKQAPPNYPDQSK